MPYGSISIESINNLLHSVCDQLSLYDWEKVWNNMYNTPTSTNLTNKTVFQSIKEIPGYIAKIEGSQQKKKLVNIEYIQYINSSLFYVINTFFEYIGKQQQVPLKMPLYDTFLVKEKELREHIRNLTDSTRFYCVLCLCIEDISLVLIENDKFEMDKKQDEITSLLERSHTQLNEWNNNKLLQYPMSLHVLIDLSVFLVRFIQMISTCMTIKLNDHSPFISKEGWLNFEDSSNIATTKSEEHNNCPNQKHEIPIVESESKRIKVDKETIKPKPKPKPKPKSKPVYHEIESLKEEEENTDYPHRSARKGDRFNATVHKYDENIAKSYHPTRTPPVNVWDPSRVNESELDHFLSLFQADVLEDIYLVIQQKNYNLEEAYKELERNPPVNPVTQFSPENERRLEDSIDDLTNVHHKYFSHVNSTDVVNLFYHMDASFKDDTCAICRCGGSLIFCPKCPRGFHKTCLPMPSVKDFICPYCLVNKEQLTPDQIDRIMRLYKMRLADKNIHNGRNNNKK